MPYSRPAGPGSRLGFCIALVLAAFPVRAAGLSGTVTADGKPLDKAWVQLNTGLIAQTDARGRFTFAGLPRATYAAQVLAPGRKPAVLAGLVPGSARADCALTADGSLGLVHVKATGADGALCPVRLVTRWRAADGQEWQTPGDLTGVSTLDYAGQPFLPAEASRTSIVPYGACLWTQGEAVMALPPGQAELTCTAGPLMRVAQQTVEVKAAEVTEIAVAMARGAELRAIGWTNGIGGLQVGGADPGPHRTNLPLAAAICRAEGCDWAVLSPSFGADPAQGPPQPVAAELSDARCAIWVSPEVATGEAVVIGPAEPLPDGAPAYHVAAGLKRSVLVYGSPFAGGAVWELPFALLAQPAAVPVLNVAPAGKPEAFELWSQLLQRGLRLGPVAFAATRLDRGELPLPERTFVRIEGNVGPAEVAAGLRRGATCVSTGPVLSLAVGEALPGDTLPPDDRTHIIEMDAVVGCIPGQGVSRLELLRGGRVARTWDVAEVGPNHLQARLAIRENAPTWIGLRAYGTDPACVAWTAPVYFAQDDPSPAPLETRIAGRVTDGRAGTPISGARVTASAPPSRSMSALTRADGTYELVAPVVAVLEVTHPAYQVTIAPVGPDPQPRAEAGAKWLPWDCPPLSALLRALTPADYPLETTYQRLSAALEQARLDFELTPR